MGKNRSSPDKVQVGPGGESLEEPKSSAEANTSTVEV